MKRNAKVQTNEHNVNVLVETNNSSNQSWSHLNREVDLNKVLTDEEIIELWKNREIDDKLQIAKDWIKKQQGYAISICIDETLNITFRSIVKYIE